MHRFATKRAEELWHGTAPEQQPDPSAGYCCEAAWRLMERLEVIIGRISNQTTAPTAEQLVMAKALILDEYHTTRKSVTKAHRDRLHNKDGLLCVHGVFIASLERLADIGVAIPKIPRQAPSGRRASEPTIAELILGARPDRS